MQHHSYGNQHTSGIAKAADLLCQALQLKLQRTFALVILQLLRQLSIDRVSANFCDLQHACALHNDAAAVHSFLCKKVYFLAPGKACCRWQLLCLLAFTVERRLVKLQLALQQHAVRRHSVASLQNHRITDNNIVNRDFHRLAITPYLAADTAGLLL